MEKVRTDLVSTARTNLSYLPKYFRKGKAERDVLSPCALRYFVMANFFMDDTT